MKLAKIKDKERLQLELNFLTSEISKLTKKANIIKEQLKDIEVKIRAKGVHLSNHAIERFRKRITGKYTSTDIKDMLLTKAFIKRVHSIKEGMIDHPEIDNCVCVVRDNLVITILNKYDPEWELKQLGFYMKYFINTIADNRTPLSFEKFKIKNSSLRELRKNNE